jgi:hypothetical protein
MDDDAEEDDVRARAQRRIDVAHCRGAGEPRVDMYEGRFARLCQQCKPGGDRVILGHVGPHDEDAVRIGQVPLRERCRSPSVARAQTWDGGAVSDPRLVLDPNHAEAAPNNFLMRQFSPLSSVAPPGEATPRV